MPAVETEEVAETDLGIEGERIEAEPVVEAESSIDAPLVHPKFQPTSAADEAITTEVETISVPVEKPLEVVSVDEELEVLKPGCDPEILEIYLEEAEEESLNIARLQQDWLLHPEDENAVKNIRRAFHTIKGLAGFFGLEDIQKLAHEAENLLDKVRQGELELIDSSMDVTFEAA